MSGKPLHELSIAEAGKLIRSGALTSTALTEASLKRIAALDGPIASFITVTGERAMADAAAADAAFAKGVDKGPMQGIPYALKDIYMTAGIRSTCHSKLLVDNVPAEDCVVETKFKAAGAVHLGKLATHEFAFGGPSFDLPFPPARNPWNTDHITGGSSSGSGAAVAAGFCRTAMGSDTGGSIRGPAAYCGTVGLKPTYGLVSRRGIFPLSFTLDHAGPLTWSVEDCAITMQAIAGFDPEDPASADLPVPDFLGGLNEGVEGMRIALPRCFWKEAAGLSAETAAAIEAAAGTLEKLGAKVEEVTLPDYELFNAAGRLILFSEAYAIHEKDLQTRPLDYGALTQMRMILGGFIQASDLTQAFRVRRKLSLVLNREVLGTYDALITASALAPAPRFDEMPKGHPANWPIQTIPYNLTGNPAMSIPTGFSKSGLPLSMQIVGKPFADPTVLRIGQAYEAATGLTAIRPKMEMAEAA
ncbi:amidase [Prosthecomicrobium sp. N25]|uniref:amidase n=1 Tax=Prosthecomicrobium sp. N25 TaxID=3129254 RepID=UPI0030787F77